MKANLLESFEVESKHGGRVEEKHLFTRTRVDCLAFHCKQFSHQINAKQFHKDINLREPHFYISF